MTTYNGTDGGVIAADHDEHGVYLRARYGAAHLQPDAARRLAADLLVLADEADAWMTSARD
jgi:hypothetical protein